MFVSFTFIPSTLDECKTLTKISTRKTSHNRSPKLAHTSDDKETGRKPSIKRQTTGYRKELFASLVENPEALGFHQETTEESRQQQDWFCIKLYIIFVPN